ncbi:hypothetical protein QBC37DRAFT_447603 [Rhypophila decipiens]|uniref:Glycosyltransferase family 4 protein n=1 Tax=Rhypophila decipiens TaxID=261697 RepID=A0AAN7B4N3_9PEZI|nr:hypothetical protein QBC37DRAFT_447603 [Rhypophila decipiens]
MRVFLVQTAHGLTPSSGGYKSNISLLRQLRSFGHKTAQLCYGTQSEVDQFVRRAVEKGVEPNLTTCHNRVIDPQGQTHDIWVKNFTSEDNVEYTVLDCDAFETAYPRVELFYETQGYLDGEPPSERLQALMLLFQSRILAFEPTHVIFNDAFTLKLTYDMHRDLPAHGTPSPLGSAHDPFVSRFKRISIIHTAEQLPFGPYSGQILGHCASPYVEDLLLRGLDGIWTVSEALRDYAWEWGRLPTKHLLHSTMAYLDPATGALPLRRHNITKFEVGMINPCPHKGLDILLALADNMPDIQFVVWTSWGSEEEHIERMRQYSNITIEPATNNTDEIWDRIRVLIVPSVWFEAWGMVVTEAQLRGIPVIASNAGGLVEAKLGIPFCLPVNLVTGKKDEKDDYVVPPQDLSLWIDAVHVLVHGKRKTYNIFATASYTLTRIWYQSIGDREIEDWLLKL